MKAIGLRGRTMLMCVICSLITGNVSAQENGEGCDVRLPVLEVTMPETPSRDMDYVNGRMKLTDEEGNVTEMPARFKTRGATARYYMMKPSLNMKLRNEDYTEEVDANLLGMRDCSSWILDAMAIDRICMRNRVAFDIWNEFSRLPYDTEFDGRNGTVGRFIEVYINKKYYGIYCLTDRINRKLLDLKKVKEQDDGSRLVRGVLYKNGTEKILNQNSPCYNDDFTACVVEWHNAWELTFPDDDASAAVWAPLQEAILKGTSVAYVQKYFYWDNLAEYEILIMALSITDNWGNKNRYLSIRNINKDIDASDWDDASRRKFVLTPWDLDTSLGGYYDGSCYDGSYSDFPVEDVPKLSPYPIGPLVYNANYNALLKQKWAEGRRGAFSVYSIKSKMRGYCDLFMRSGAWDRMVNHFETYGGSKPCYVIDLKREIELVGQWYEARFREMDAYFGISDTAEDVNGDGVVDSQDVLAVLSACDGDVVYPAADVNHDGTIDGRDLEMVYDYIISH